MAAAGARRENVVDLIDDGSWVEYGRYVVAAQRGRRDIDDLIANTPADGLVAGTATVAGHPTAVLAYDDTVLAGTPAQTRLRGTGTITLTASPLAGLYPLHVTCSGQRVADGQYTPKVPLFAFTVAGVAYHGGLVGPEFGDDVLFGTGPGLSHAYRASAPVTLTLDNTGGSITNVPLKTVDPADIDVLRLDAGTMSLTWHC